ncbi:MAG TPA: hypothetical protein VGA70_09840, partial [Longimicrobiales bacterium]
MRRSAPFIALALAGLWAAVSPDAASAQGDVEMLGRQYGTRPPQAYYDLVRADPTAFTFSRGMMRRNPSLRPRQDALPGELAFVMGPPQGGAVEGEFTFPLIMGYFADTPL